IEVIWQTETVLAHCVRATEGGRDIWIPKAQCEVEPIDGGMFHALTRGCLATLTAPEALLIEKGLV
ncbi:MAG: hypothetical protein H5U20_04125, partial [Rhodobacteraceae bacterium]|nr:hypothetical protein [Paracoccaceae bacterium]